MSSYEFYLKRPANNISWRPAFVRNMTNFANTIKTYREKYAKAPQGSAEERKVVANFNKAYGAWITKVKNENARRRAQESAFFKNLTAARKSGNAAAVSAVLAKYSNAAAAASPRRASASPARRRSPVAREPPPKRSGEQRNTRNLRKALAHRNLSRLKANLMAQKAALEVERNRLETQIFALIRQIGELPNI
jgi:hypothetical protein